MTRIVRFGLLTFCAAFMFASPSTVTRAGEPLCLTDTDLGPACFDNGCNQTGGRCRYIPGARVCICDRRGTTPSAADAIQ